MENEFKFPKQEPFEKMVQRGLMFPFKNDLLSARRHELIEAANWHRSWRNGDPFRASIFTAFAARTHPDKTVIESMTISEVIAIIDRQRKNTPRGYRYKWVIDNGSMTVDTELAAPRLLKAVKDTLETLRPIQIVQLEPLKAYLRECVSEAESGRGDDPNG